MNLSRLEVGLLCTAAVIGASCATQFPPPNASTPHQPVIYLHGFFDEYNSPYIDTLNDLLLAEIKGLPLPKNWIGRIPLLDYGEMHQPWYVDASNNGKDNDPQYGLESSTLAFYAGHGHDIDGWYVPHPDYSYDWVPVKSIRVGDQSLRYFWLYSCKVLAHGPKEVSGGRHYSAPQCFRPGLGHGDVFDRWTAAFAPSMRMACGGSTNLGHTGVEEIWNYLLEVETSVADAWILGIAHPKEVPVCLARGGEDRASSALADRTLHSGEVAEKGWLHFQYPVNCKVQTNVFPLHVICNRPSPCDDSSKALEPDLSLPKQEPLPTAVPSVAINREKAGALVTQSQGDKSLPLGFLQPAGLKNWKYHPESGSVVLVKSRDSADQYKELTSCNAESEWTIRPSALLKQSGLDDIGDLKDSGLLENFSVTALEMRVESRQDGKVEPHCSARSLFLLFRQQVDLGTKHHPKVYPVFGPPIAFELQRQGDKLASFSTPRLGLSIGKDTIPLQPEETAKQEAREALQLSTEEYPTENARVIFGYEQAPLRCKQELLRPTYEIQFFPSEAAQPNRPIVTVRRDARLNPPDTSWKCPGWGDFPPP